VVGDEPVAPFADAGPPREFARYADDPGAVVVGQEEGPLQGLSTGVHLAALEEVRAVPPVVGQAVDLGVGQFGEADDFDGGALRDPFGRPRAKATVVVVHERRTVVGCTRRAVVGRT